jgi:hypothetical protein
LCHLLDVALMRRRRDGAYTCTSAAGVPGDGGRRKGPASFSILVLAVPVPSTGTGTGVPSIVLPVVIPVPVVPGTVCSYGSAVSGTPVNPIRSVWGFRSSLRGPPVPGTGTGTAPVQYFASLPHTITWYTHCNITFISYRRRSTQYPRYRLPRYRYHTGVLLVHYFHTVHPLVFFKFPLPFWLTRYLHLVPVPCTSTRYRYPVVAWLLLIPVLVPSLLA